MATNQNNFGVLNGRLTKDVKAFENKDGSRKVFVTIAVDNNYAGADGKRGSQFINTEAFVPASVQGLGVFEHIHEGDLVGVLYHLESDQYTKDGQTVYAQKVVIDSVDFKEPRNVTQARLAQRTAKAAEAASAPVAAPAVDASISDEDSPFAG